MKTDKTKLLQDIKAMKEKLASMEEELNEPDEFKHFPSKGEVYYFYTSSKGAICSNTASDNNLKVNTYRTEKEAEKAYDKAVATECYYADGEAYSLQKAIDMAEDIESGQMEAVEEFTRILYVLNSIKRTNTSKGIS